jgi:ABC-type transport system involved in multi-copper enzyme maturation permease subunit
MKATLAIARLVILTALRSRLLQMMAVLAMLCIAGLPFLLKGDGTVAGRLRVLLTYATGAAWLLLAGATLWSACGLIAREIEDRSLRLVAVKPVHAAHIWFGKWLGIAAVNLALIGLVTLLTGAMLALTLAPLRGTADPADRAAVAAILSSRRAVAPAQPSLAHQVAQQVADWIAGGLMPDTPAARRAAAQSARSDLLARRATVPPGKESVWVFPIDDRLAAAARRGRDTLHLHFHYTSSPLERREVHGAWSFHCGATTVGPLPTGARFDGRHVIPLPEAIVDALRTARGDLRVTFANGDADRSITVMFDTARPVALLLRDGSFGINLLRIHAVAFGFMCTLGALGLAAGTLFSYPVALFAGIGFLFAISVANSNLANDTSLVAATTTGLAGQLNRIGEHLLVAARSISAPAFGAEPLARLAEGTALPWMLTAQTCGLLIVLYPLLFGLAGAFMLARRQLAR